MIPTPILPHLKGEEYADVYEPAEDTFLLLDALEADADFLKRNNPQICLEIGSGSGCVSAFIGNILGQSALYLCTDINPRACECSALTGIHNKVTLDSINAPFAMPLESRLKHNVDIILFNPPYVPTSSEEASRAQNIQDITGSWAGGSNGMEVTDRFLLSVDNLLSKQGKFYLVALMQNDIPGIQSRMFQSYGLTSTIILQRRAGREHLFILRFIRADPDNIS